MPSEIQLQTTKGWEIKKQTDSIYHVLREQKIKQTLTDQKIEALKVEKQEAISGFRF
ncbi:hypothetical protein [Helicobacter suis]|uniref:hypothetical protein n=1 Tax=Helicobacter suis TaxID=104628 RepID=UPI0013D41A96|nr:hypothetical protein [Helicobacter suis]